MDSVALQEFYQLLQLENKNNSFIRLNQKDFQKLLDFRVRIQFHLNWKQKVEYRTLISDFFKKKMTSDDFAIIFINTYFDVSKEIENLEHMVKETKHLDQLVENSNLLELLEPPTESQKRFSELLMKLEGDCESFSLDPELNTMDFYLNEDEFRLSVLQSFRKLKNYFN